MNLPPEVQAAVTLAEMAGHGVLSPMGRAIYLEAYKLLPDGGWRWTAVKQIPLDATPEDRAQAICCMVAQANADPPADRRYGFGWTDPRGIFGGSNP